MNLLLAIVIVSTCISLSFCGYSSKDSVKLTDIQVLTLHHGKMTNGRRSAPVPQLKCVGGTAGCAAFTPKVVQCSNQGWDGIDVQWKCKTDMDNAYRFGEISVSCEGFSYSDDPYVLKGSCGLEYTIDLTKEEHQSRGHHHDYYGGESENLRSKSSNFDQGSKSSFLANLILIAIVALIIYALYKTCLSPTAENMFQSSNTNEDFRGYPGGNPYRANAPPPPPGFRSDFMPDAGTSTGASCGGDQSGSRSNLPRSPAGGFWTGAATGGLLGYMFGSRNSGGTSQNYRTRENVYASPSENQFWGGTGGTTRRSSSSSSNRETPSSGTRTASGFGGTTRR